MASNRDITTLLDIMRRLRDPKSGCPWDLEQTFATIAPYTIEEAYEVAAAIEDEDWPALKEELGDFLFQVADRGVLSRGDTAGQQDHHDDHADDQPAVAAALVRRRVAGTAWPARPTRAWTGEGTSAVYKLMVDRGQKQGLKTPLGN